MLRHRRCFFSAPRGWAGAVTMLAVALFASPAAAYEEQAALDLGAGYTLRSSSPPLSASGAELSVGAATGISDLFFVRFALGYGLFASSNDFAHVGRARAEMAYLIDVVRIVPFVGLGAGVFVYDDAGLDLRPGAHLLLGFDYLWSREWNVGLDVRPGLAATRHGSVTTLEGQLRLSRMFDLF